MLKSHYRLIHWPNFNTAMSLGLRKPKERERDERMLVNGAVRLHNLLIKFLYEHGLWCQQAITNLTSKFTDHHSKYNNNEKVRNIVEITKM